VHPFFPAALRELEHTTHFAVIDAAGTVVSCTTTLSASYGARVLVPGTGIVLNNSAASFATVGANLPAPGRRTISSMAPTLVLDRDQPVLVLGTPGGDTIGGTVVQVFRNMVDYGMTLADAVNAPRIHHGFVPDSVRLEITHRPPKHVIRGLEQLGHRISKAGLPIGDANTIAIVDGVAWGYADPREGGLAAAAKP
jgi:gamma-glutamyltranspeptidase/glutathione hydrolase